MKLRYDTFVLIRITIYISYRTVLHAQGGGDYHCGAGGIK